MLFSFISCSDKMALEDCDQFILDFYDAIPFDGEDVGCNYFVVKAVYTDGVIYNMDRLCNDMGQSLIVEPLHRDCDGDIFPGPIGDLGELIRKETIGILN